jgi:hypothetical protein
VVLDNDMNVTELINALSDTGALDANYVAKKLLDTIRSRLPDSAFFDTKCKVTLVDSRTSIDISKGVRLNLVLEDKRKHTYENTGEFLIIDMENNDVILGLPALTGKLFPFFESLMEDAHAKTIEKMLVDSAAASSDLATELDLFQSLEKCRSTAFDADLRQPWLNKDNDEAPEDAETDIPVQFGDALEFMGKPRDQALKEYYEMHDSHLNDIMKTQTELPKLLATETAEKVFVADEWSGINGIEVVNIFLLQNKRKEILTTYFSLVMNSGSTMGI